MISEAEALNIAQRFIDEATASVDGGAVVIGERTIRKPYGWIFFYNSRRHLETGDPLEALGGNGPVIVELETGQLHALASSADETTTIAAFERTNRFPG